MKEGKGGCTVSLIQTIRAHPIGRPPPNFNNSSTTTTNNNNKQHCTYHVLVWFPGHALPPEIARSFTQAWRVCVPMGSPKQLDQLPHVKSQSLSGHWRVCGEGHVAPPWSRPGVAVLAPHRNGLVP